MPDTQFETKLVLVAFGLIIGACLAFWPQQVNRKFRRWNGHAPDPREEDLTPAHRQHQLVMVQTIRRAGIFLLCLTLFGIDTWIHLR